MEPPFPPRATSGLELLPEEAEIEGDQEEGEMRDRAQAAHFRRAKGGALWLLSDIGSQCSRRSPTLVETARAMAVSDLTRDKKLIVISKQP
jgi:hypothetical protein